MKESELPIGADTESFWMVSWVSKREERFFTSEQQARVFASALLNAQVEPPLNSEKPK